MYSQEALSLIKIAQLNPADRSQVVRRLWNIHEKSLMKYAIRLSRTMEPDFAMRGMNDAARRDFLMGETRFSSLQRTFPDTAEALFEKTEEDAKDRYEGYVRLTKAYDEK